MEFPDLKRVDRDREFRIYPEKIRDRVIYEYLFNGKSHRWLDENIIGVNSSYSRGWQSMGILHYLGIVDVHKGIFSGTQVLDAISFLSDNGKDKYKNIILALMRYTEYLYSDESLDMFNPPLDAPALIKTVGTSQYTDGVRIDASFPL